MNLLDQARHYHISLRGGVSIPLVQIRGIEKSADERKICPKSSDSRGHPISRLVLFYSGKTLVCRIAILGGSLNASGVI